MIIRITLYYKNKPAPLSKLFKVPKNWLIIVEKTRNETNIKSGLGDVFYTFKNKNVERYEIEKAEIDSNIKSNLSTYIENSEIL